MGDAFVRGEYSFVGSSLSLANGGTGLHRAEYSLLDLRGGHSSCNGVLGLTRDDACPSSHCHRII